MKVNEHVRPSLVHDIFYPSDVKTLRSLLEGGERAPLSKPIPSRGSLGNTPPALLLPHAAYEFVLPHILLGFDILRELYPPPERFVLLAGLHREKESALFLSPFDAFESPLGPVELDRETQEKLISFESNTLVDESVFLEEHSFEVLLPPIRHFFPGIPVLIILAGNSSQSVINNLQEMLRRSAENSVFLISSNLSAETDVKNAELQADAFLDAIGFLETNDSEKGHDRCGRLLQFAENGRIGACGIAAVAAFLKNYPRTRPLLLSEGSSKRTSDTREVRYASVLFDRSPP